MIRSILLLENKSDNHSSSVKSTFYKWKDYDVKSRSDLMQAVWRTGPVLPPHHGSWAVRCLADLGNVLVLKAESTEK